MQEVFFDRLYKEIFLNKFDVALLQQPRVNRTRRISLSAIPSHLTNFGTHADRCEHSIGAGDLANYLHRDFDGFRTLIHRAVFLHDCGHPPFSHTSEPYLKQICHKDHEAMVGEMLNDEKITQIIQEEGLEVEDVLSMIKGDFPIVGKIVNGSIDLDNLDNTLRYGLSGGLASISPYSPQNLAQAFRLVNGKIALHTNCRFQLQSWKIVRDEVYKMVYDDANLRGGMMLERAIDLAYQEDQIKPDFFWLTDDAAVGFLLEKTNPRTRQLIEDASNRNFYEKVFDLEQVAQVPQGQGGEYFQDWRGRNKLVDDLAQTVSLDPAHISAYLGVSKGSKNIDLPFWDEEHGFMKQPYEQTPKTYLVKVYLSPTVQHKAQGIPGLLSELYPPVKN